MLAEHWNMQICTTRPHWRFCETLNYIKYRFWMDFVFAGAKSEIYSMSNEGISVQSRIWKHHRIDTCNIGEGGRSRHQRNWSLWSRETQGNQRMRKKRNGRQRSKFAPSIEHLKWAISDFSLIVEIILSYWLVSLNTLDFWRWPMKSLQIRQQYRAFWPKMKV